MDWLYRRALRRLGLRRTITEYVRQWQHAEPLLFLLAAAAAGISLGRLANAGALVWFGAGLGLGILLGHFFWGKGYHDNRGR